MLKLEIWYIIGDFKCYWRFYIYTCCCVSDFYGKCSFVNKIRTDNEIFCKIWLTEKLCNIKNNVKRIVVMVDFFMQKCPTRNWQYNMICHTMNCFAVTRWRLTLSRHHHIRPWVRLRKRILRRKSSVLSHWMIPPRIAESTLKRKRWDPDLCKILILCKIPINCEIMIKRLDPD